MAVTGPKPAGAKAPAKRTNGGAARREASGEPPTIEWRGVTFTLPVKAPFRLLKFMGKGDATGVAEVLGLAETLFGDQFDQVYDMDLDIDEGTEAIRELLQLAFAEYGMTPGESPASPSS